MAALRQGLRLLFDKYQSCLDGMEENLPKALVPENPILSEEILIGEDALRDAATLMEEATQFEREATRARVEALEARLNEEQERMNLRLETFKVRSIKANTCRPSVLILTCRLKAEFTGMINHNQNHN